MALKISNHVHLSQNVRDAYYMVRHETHRENSRHQESLYDDLLFSTLPLRVAISQGHRPQFVGDLHIKAKKRQVEKQKQHHSGQVNNSANNPLAVEVEADLVARMFLAEACKEGSRSRNEDHPDGITYHLAPARLLDTKDPNRFDDFQVAVQADQTEEEDAGVHVYVEEDAHHLAQIKWSFSIVVVDTQRQTQDQEGVRQRQVTHVHGHGRICVPAEEKYVEGHGVAEESGAADDDVANGQEGRQRAIVDLAGFVSSNIAVLGHCDSQNLL